MARAVTALALLTALAAPAAAAEVEAPAALHGVWAAPACAGDAPVTVWLSHGALVIGSDGAAYRPLENAEIVGDWLKLERDGAPAYFGLPGPDTLRLAVAKQPSVPPPDPPAALDPSDARWDVTDFARCKGLPSAHAVPHGEAVAMLAGLDRLRSACGAGAAGSDVACAAGLFRLADLSGNGELSVAELARVGRVGAYFAAVAGGEAVATGDLLAGFAGAVALTPLLAKAIVSSFDYDDSGAVSLAELMQNRETMFETAAEATALGAAARPRIEALIEQLKGAEQMLRMLMR